MDRIRYSVSAILGNIWNFATLFNRENLSSQPSYREGFTPIAIMVRMRIESPS